MTLSKHMTMEPDGEDRQDLANRRVGVEVEFGGLSAKEAASVLHGITGGQVTELDPHRFEIECSDLGKLRVELDSKYVHGSKDASKLERSAREWAGDVSDALVPTELVTDPLPVSALSKVDHLVAALATAGATGNEQPHLACGLHLNIEWADREVEPILRILQAFMILAPELRTQIDPDTTRKLLPFIAQYRGGYQDKVLDPAYSPDFPEFVRDYCEANPNKNRELDLFPLLASIDRDVVASVLGEDPSAVRPAFHYRLPDARIGDSSWSISQEWQRWLAIEDLARDRSTLLRRISDMQSKNRKERIFNTAADAIKRVMNK